MDYDITYGPLRDGRMTVTVTGKGNYTSAIRSTYIIGEKAPDAKIFTGIRRRRAPGPTSVPRDPE